MKYRIAAFTSDIQWGKELGTWLSDPTLYDSYDLAYTARDVMCEQIPINIKVKVFGEQEWRALPVGYKHPLDRKYMEVNPNPIVREYKGIKNSLKKRPYTLYRDGSRFYPEIYITSDTYIGLRTVPLQGGLSKDEISETPVDGQKYKEYWSREPIIEDLTTIIGANEFSDNVDLVTDMGAALKAAGL